MKKSYEAVFILTPVLSETQMKDTVDKLKDVLAENGADLINEEHWGLKKLAYPIQHKTTGLYNLFEFNAEPATVDAFEIACKRDEKVMRFLTVALDKHALEYNDKRRKGAFNKKKEEVAS
jgi:small subunit ribosomal protein S6